MHVAGDHDVVIGRVLELEATPAWEQPMLFFRGRFGVEDANSGSPRTCGAGAITGVRPPRVARRGADLAETMTRRPTERSRDGGAPEDPGEPRET